VLGAKVKIAGEKGEREVLLEKFFKGPGKMVLGIDEVVTEVVVPNERMHSGSKYEKLFARTSVDLAAVGAACWVLKNPKDGVVRDIRIALGAVAPVPLRARRAEKVLKGKVASEELIKGVGEVAAEEAKPISDIRASAEYRREMVKVMVRRAVKGALERAV
jgi:carbon-monoxide dehydrogenase medium subunit